MAIIGANSSGEALTDKNYGAKVLGEDNYNDLESITAIAEMGIITSQTYINYPSAGSSANSLSEQQVIESAKSNQTNGTVIINSLRDTRMPGWMGWQKYSFSTNDIDVHYVGNKIILFFFDYKIKDK